MWIGLYVLNLIQSYSHYTRPVLISLLDFFGCGLFKAKRGHNELPLSEFSEVHILKIHCRQKSCPQFVWTLRVELTRQIGHFGRSEFSSSDWLSTPIGWDRSSSGSVQPEDQNLWSSVPLPKSESDNILEKIWVSNFFRLLRNDCYVISMTYSLLRNDWNFLDFAFILVRKREC